MARRGSRGHHQTGVSRGPQAQGVRLRRCKADGLLEVEKADGQEVPAVANGVWAVEDGQKQLEWKVVSCRKGKFLIGQETEGSYWRLTKRLKAAGVWGGKA